MNDDEYEIEGLHEDIDHLHGVIQELEAEVTVFSNEVQDVRNELHQEKEERASLEKDYDRLSDKAEYDAEQNDEVCKVLAKRAIDVELKWELHLKYLEEYWPYVLADMLLRSDVK